MKNLTVIDKNSVIVRMLKKIPRSFEVRYKMWWEKRCNASFILGDLFLSNINMEKSDNLVKLSGSIIIFLFWELILDLIG